MALSPGLLDSMPGAVAIAQANDSESSTTERRARAATRWVHGRDRQHRPQSGDEVSDQFGFVSEVGVFCDAGVTRAVLTVNADVLGDRRSLAPYYWCPGRAKPRGHISVLGRYAEHRGPSPQPSPHPMGRGRKYFCATLPGVALGPCGRPPELTPGYYRAALSGR